MKQLLLVILLLTAIPFPAMSQDTDDAALDERVRVLAEQLRCLVCQNETLADSQAMLAIDLKRQIKEQMKAGKSDQEILGYLTQRYGDFVLYRPPVKRSTYLLWFGPFIFLAGGLFILFHYIRSRREQIHDVPLTPEEHRRAVDLLSSESGKEVA